MAPIVLSVPFLLMVDVENVLRSICSFVLETDEKMLISCITANGLISLLRVLRLFVDLLQYNFFLPASFPVPLLPMVDAKNVFRSFISLLRNLMMKCWC